MLRETHVKSNKWGYRKTPKISPGPYIFQRAFWRGLYTEGNLCFKIGYDYIWRKIGISKSIGLAYSWKEIYFSNLPKGFTETRSEDVDLSKTKPCNYFVYMDRENPSQEWTVVTVINCDTFWLQSFGTRNSYLANTRIVLHCIWGQFPSTNPRGAYIQRGDSMEGFLRYQFGEAYIWRGLYLEGMKGLIFGISR